MPAFPTCRSLRLAAVFCLALSVAGCGTLEFFYNRADWLATEYVTGMVSLDDAQSTMLSRRFEETLEWHRAEELPRYEQLLEAAAALVRAGPDNPASEADIEALLKRAEARRAALGARVAEAAAPVLVTLSASQIDELAESLAERARERQSEFAQADRAERLEARRERMVKRVESWTSTLSDEQVAQVEAASDAFPDETGSWAAWQEQAGDTLIAHLRGGADVATVELHLANWLGSTRARPEAVVASTDAWRGGIVGFVRRVDAMLTDDQRRHVLELMVEYADVTRSAAGT